MMTAMPASPEGCERCWPASPTAAVLAVRALPVDDRLIDESHFIVLLRSCPACSQAFLQVTTECIDWEDGEDSIERAVMPVSVQERDALSQASPLSSELIGSMGVGRRSLWFSLPKGHDASTFWGTGITVGPHD